MKSSLSAFVVGVAVVLGCAGAGVEPAQAQQRGRADQPLPKGVVLEKLPEGAVEVRDALEPTKSFEVRVHGRIPNRRDAVSNSEPVFLIADDARVAECCPADGSTHECAIAPEQLIRVRLVDSSGKALRGGLTGKGGLRPGAEVFIIGAPTDWPKNGPVEIDATGVHIPRESLPAGFFVQETPEGVRDVSEVRTAGGLMKGDTVVLRGKVGGSVEPFVAERAVFTLVGSGIKSCDENPDDQCKRPWDYCCETRAMITAHSATIRVPDAKGNPLRTDVKGRAGIKELSELVVVGKVATAEKGALIVDATSVHVVKP